MLNTRLCKRCQTGQTHPNDFIAETESLKGSVLWGAIAQLAVFTMGGTGQILVLLVTIDIRKATSFVGG